jgi:hypothetical protein
MEVKEHGRNSVDLLCSNTCSVLSMALAPVVLSEAGHPAQAHSKQLGGSLQLVLYAVGAERALAILWASIGKHARLLPELTGFALGWPGVDH